MCQELSHWRKLLCLFPHFVPEKFQAKVSVSQNNEVIHWVLYPEVLDWKETMYYRWPLGLFRCREEWVAAIVYVWSQVVTLRKSHPPKLSRNEKAGHKLCSRSLWDEQFVKNQGSDLKLNEGQQSRLRMQAAKLKLSRFTTSKPETAS